LAFSDSSFGAVSAVSSGTRIFARVVLALVLALVGVFLDLIAMGLRNRSMA